MEIGIYIDILAKFFNNEKKKNDFNKSLKLIITSIFKPSTY